jgi:hypothetical protein
VTAIGAVTVELDTVTQDFKARLQPQREGQPVECSIRQILNFSATQTD